MSWMLASFAEALQLAFTFDPKLIAIIGLTLEVSVTSAVVAALVGGLIGAGVAVGRFRGRGAVIVLLNAAMGVPPVVAGLIVYLLLSRAGPLGSLGILFTPTAMVIAQVLLITPIVAALSRQIIEDAWREYEEQLTSLGVTRARAALTILWDTRFSLATVGLAGLGRAMAEVGAVIVVGGNIEGVTRVMTTAIALETTKGDLPLALALGVILLTVVLLLNLAAHFVREWSVRKYG
jgi:tungstate transport system permease protein